MVDILCLHPLTGSSANLHLLMSLTMTENKDDKVYVVFIGRKPGIYFSWRHCDAQVNGYPGNRHKGFFSFQQAEREWINHCIEIGRGEAWARLQIHRHYEVGSTSQQGGGNGTRCGDMRKIHLTLSCTSYNLFFLYVPFDCST